MKVLAMERKATPKDSYVCEKGILKRGVQVTPRMNKAILGELAEDVFNDYRKNRYKTLPHT